MYDTGTTTNLVSLVKPETSGANDPYASSQWAPTRTWSMFDDLYANDLYALADYFAGCR